MEDLPGIKIQTSLHYHSLKQLKEITRCYSIVVLKNYVGENRKFEIIKEGYDFIILKDSLGNYIKIIPKK